jgi:hypothetical protein
MLLIAKQMKEQIEARELIEAEAASKAAARKRA